MLANFLRRAAVGVVGFALLFVLGFWGGWWIFVPVCAIALIGMGEYYSALHRKNLRPSVGWGYICGIAVLAVTWFCPPNVRGEATLGVLFASVAISLVVQFAQRRDQSAVVNSSVTAFGVVYIALLMSYFLRLRHVDIPGALHAGTRGTFPNEMGAILLVVIPVWMGDTVAYLVGNEFGRHKLCPTISPGKTVEGSLGNLCANVLFALLVGSAWLHLPVRDSLAIGLIMGTIGQVGDIAKSALKRDLGIKDFGGVFGAHGGVIDRFDALLFVMPLVYWFLTLTLGS